VNGIIPRRFPPAGRDFKSCLELGRNCEFAGLIFGLARFRFGALEHEKIYFQFLGVFVFVRWMFQRESRTKAAPSGRLTIRTELYDAHKSNDEVCKWLA
jgi:hypothetical protein